MSAPQIEEIITRFIDAWNAGDITEMLGALQEDVALDFQGRERIIGRDAFREYHAENARHFDGQFSDVVVMTNGDGRHAAAEVTSRGTYRETSADLPEASGQSFSVPAGLFFEIDDGAISRVTFYVSHRGLEEQLSR